MYEDTVVIWLREVVGKNLYRTNQRWVETPDGYLWAPHIQPVQNLPISPEGEEKRGDASWALTNLAQADLPAYERRHDRRGWYLPGVGWVSLFVGTGVAIHSTFWHNNYSEPMSRGCVNPRPEDSKWVFRWTLPNVSYDPGGYHCANGRRHHRRSDGFIKNPYGDCL